MWAEQPPLNRTLASQILWITWVGEQINKSKHLSVYNDTYLCTSSSNKVLFAFMGNLQCFVENRTQRKIRVCGANFLWPNLHLCYSNFFLHLCDDDDDVEKDKMNQT